MFADPADATSEILGALEDKPVHVRHKKPLQPLEFMGGLTTHSLQRPGGFVIPTLLQRDCCNGEMHDPRVDPSLRQEFAEFFDLILDLLEFVSSAQSSTVRPETDIVAIPARVQQCGRIRQCEELLNADILA